MLNFHSALYNAARIVARIYGLHQRFTLPLQFFSAVYLCSTVTLLSSPCASDNKQTVID